MTPKVISFHYALTNTSGQPLDTSRGGDPFSFMTGSGHIIPGLEKALMELGVGDKKQIHVAAKDAYGLRDEKLKVAVSPEKLPVKDVKLGQQFRGGEGPDARVFTVVEVTASTITLDGNHPLAGQDLIFDVELTALRDATQEEIEHGHAHGGDGHHHH